MAWLVSDDRVLATLEIADTRRSRLRGLIGRDAIEGAILLRPAKGVHTFGVRFAIDVVFCDADMVVIEIVTMEPNRMGRPRPRARSVVEAAAHSCERWKVAVGDQLDVRT